MNITITSTAVEYANIVRLCERISSASCGTCTGCILSEMCAERGDGSRVEHVVRAVIGEDGASNG